MALFIYECCDSTQSLPKSNDVTCFLCGKPVQARGVAEIVSITPTDLNPEEVQWAQPWQLQHLMYELPDGTS